jgi:hypothetical protein
LFRWTCRFGLFFIKQRCDWWLREAASLSEGHAACLITLGPLLRWSWFRKQNRLPCRRWRTWIGCIEKTARCCSPTKSPASCRRGARSDSPFSLLVLVVGAVAAAAAVTFAITHPKNSVLLLFFILSLSSCLSSTLRLLRSVTHCLRGLVVRSLRQQKNPYVHLYPSARSLANTLISNQQAASRLSHPTTKILRRSPLPTTVFLTESEGCVTDIVQSDS